MQTRLIKAGLALTLFISMISLGSGVIAQQQVSPPETVTEDYIPPQNLDPNLMVIQIKRLEDRVLALETTNERLVDRIQVLTEKFNTLIEYLNSNGQAQSN